MTKFSALNITGALAAVLWAQAAQGADLVLYSPVRVAEDTYDLTLPAVSAPNGKIELYGGLANPGAAGFRAQGAISLPVGERFGVQIDAGLSMTGAGAVFGGAVHAFTRDPNAYLLGLTGAVARGPAGTLGVIGVEGELYLDRLSLEAWAGVGGLDYDDPALADLAGVFLFADAGYYVTDDFRLTAGVSHLLGENGLHLGAEYLLRDFNAPISLTGDVRVTHTGAYTVMAGIKGYFGGDNSSKALIDRHRQDDPPIRTLSLFSAAGGLLYKTATTTPPPSMCEGDEVYLDGEGCVPAPPVCPDPDNEYPVWNGSSWDCIWDPEFT